MPDLARASAARSRGPRGSRCRRGAGSPVKGTGSRADDRRRDRGEALAAAGEAEPVGGRGAHASPARPSAADSAASASARRGADARAGCRSPARRRCRSRSPAARTRRAVSASSAAPDAPAHTGSVGAEAATQVAEPGRGQQRVAGGVRGDVAVGVPGAARRLVGPQQAGHLHGRPASNGCTSVPMPTRGIGPARRQRTPSARLRASTASASSRSSGRVTLNASSAPGTAVTRPPEPLDQRRRRRCARRRAGAGAPPRARAAEALRRLHGAQRRAVDRLHDARRRRPA